MRQLSIDQLDNEGRRVSIYDKGTPEGKTPLFQRTVSMPGVHKRVINELLRPRQWKPNHEDRRFMLAVRHRQQCGCSSCRSGLLVAPRSFTRQQPWRRCILLSWLAPCMQCLASTCYVIST